MTNTNTPKLLRAATALLLAGSLAWLMKLAVIGMTESSDGAFVSILWMTGFFSMLIGAALLAVWLTRRQNVVVRIAAALGGALLFFMSMNVLDTIAKSIAGDTGPSYLEEEWGILVAAVVWLAVALGTAKLPRSPAFEGNGRGASADAVRTDVA